MGESLEVRALGILNSKLCFDPLPSSILMTRGADVNIREGCIIPN